MRWMPIRISFSELAGEQKRLLIEEYPGLERHFTRLEDAVMNAPLSGASELMANRKGQSTPVYSLATETEIFGGAASYSKELIGIYIYSEKLQEVRIIQFLF
jgi:hypothetical protein